MGISFLFQKKKKEREVFWLYNEGEEFVQNSGGWLPQGWRNQGIAYHKVTKNKDHIEMETKCSGGMNAYHWIRTNNPVDITSFQYLNVSLKKTGENIDSGNIGFGLSSRAIDGSTDRTVFEHEYIEKEIRSDFYLVSFDIREIKGLNYIYLKNHATYKQPFDGTHYFTNFMVNKVYLS